MSTGYRDWQPGLLRALRHRGVCCWQMPDASPFPPLTYILILEVPVATAVQVGRLTEAKFEPGWLYYVGSAKRAGAHRLRRHLESRKKMHWHIDYLTTSPNLHFWAILGWQSSEQSECSLVAELAGQKGSRFAVPGFGTGDCTSRCVSHLLGFSDTSAHRHAWNWLLAREPEPLLRCSREACSDSP